MFSGIVEEVARVQSIEMKSKSGARLVIKSDLDHAETGIGDSIAINGVCLTVVAMQDGLLEFDLVHETLRCSSLGQLTAGSHVNLERSLAVGQRVSGHFVFGHVDGVVTLAEKSQQESETTLRWKTPESLMPYIATKGSIAIAGVSLTVGEVGNDFFSVYIIPHTLEKTTLGEISIGQTVNIEVDMLARYVVNAIKVEKEIKNV